MICCGGEVWRPNTPTGAANAGQRAAYAAGDSFQRPDAKGEARGVA